MKNLPTTLIPYFKGILLTQSKYCFTWISRLLKTISHDKLNRALLVEYQLQELVIEVVIKVVKNIFPVNIVIDETTLDKIFAKALEGAGFVYSSKQNGIVFGYSWVVLSIEVSGLRIPIFWQRYDKRAKATRIDIAMNLLRKFHRLKIPVKIVLFDSFYSAKKLMLLIIQFKWTFCCQIKANRLLNDQKLSSIKPTNPYWTKRGYLNGGIAVTVTKHRGKYFCVNAWHISHCEVMQFYDQRWSIEELFRFAHSQLGLSKCQARTLQIQTNHFSVCMLLSALLAIEGFKQEKTLYEIKDAIMLGEYEPKLPILKLILNYA